MFHNWVINFWNKLPDSVVLAASISSFKRRLSSFVVNVGFEQNFCQLDFSLYRYCHLLLLLTLFLRPGHLLAEVASSLGVRSGVYCISGQMNWLIDWLIDWRSASEVKVQLLRVQMCVYCIGGGIPFGGVASRCSCSKYRKSRYIIYKQPFTTSSLESSRKILINCFGYEVFVCVLSFTESVDVWRCDLKETKESSEENDVAYQWTICKDNGLWGVSIHTDCLRKYPLCRRYFCSVFHSSYACSWNFI